MEEPLSIPAAVSYRQLQSLAQAAPAEVAPATGAAGPEAVALEAALEAWSRASQQLLQALHQAGPAVAEGRAPRQLMALGALQAHVAMGLQALASGRPPRD
jgi:hypothetical protein